MRRDVKTDWTVRDDVRTKLRSSIKRLLVRHRYPPDQQPEAIRQVIEHCLWQSRSPGRHVRSRVIPSQRGAGAWFVK